MEKVILLVWMLIGGSLGHSYFPEMFKQSFPSWTLLHSPITSMILGGVLGLLLGMLTAPIIKKNMEKMKQMLSEINASYLLFGTAGAIAGLVLALLINFSLIAFKLPFISDILPIILTIILAYIGFELGSSRREEVRRLFLQRNESHEDGVLERKIGENFRKYKVLDTSVIIDGRILDIIQTGFLEGTLVVSTYVLQELQHIADSSDSLKRVRGRRGLDILNALQKMHGVDLQMNEEEIPEAEEVDMKLVYLAKKLDGVVVTNDFNLNKVAEFQHVPVLNINELANSVKPIVIPGETMRVLIVKKGTERAQGVAYLDDGTMVVVEDGKDLINEVVDVIVTSALQTNAGRMIFAKLSEEQPALPQ
ncbi:PIN domain-containing protein [Allofustis seminis]|uniref:PIN domain-containing protein n=1 Tax=Allofustis seminis TaxID=166939 RepID=UPI000371D33F